MANERNLAALIRSDLYRYAGDFKFASMCRMYIRGGGFRFTVWLRICGALHRRKATQYVLLPFAKLFYNHYKYKYGYDIPYTLDIGPGLLIYHSGGIVVSLVRCGKNLTISQNVTIGMTSHSGIKGFPTLGDNVYLAPGSAVIGGISVGNDVAIGTNCVVTKDVPDGSVVVGIPGKVISNQGSAEYVNNPL